VSLLATYAGRAADLQAWMRDAQLNTDRNLRLQYLAGMSLNSDVGPWILTQIRQHRAFPETLFVGSDLENKKLLKARLR
jgi:spermidine synthase